MSIETIKKSDYYHLSVPADGHCFFHAVTGIQHLYNNIKELRDKQYTYRLRDEGNDKWLRESKKRRKTVVQWMKDNPGAVPFKTPAVIKTAIKKDITNDEYFGV